MVNHQKWRILLCALTIVAAVVVGCLVISCSQDTPTTPSTDTATDTSTDTTADTETDGTDPVIPLPGGDLGAYQRTDTAGTMISATAVQGVSDDLSSYTSISGVVTLGDCLYAADETGQRIYKLSLTGELLGTYTSTRKINNVVTDGTSLYSLEGELNGTVVKLSSDLTTEGSVSVGHTPTDIATISSWGYVTNRFSGTVSVISITNMTLSSTIEIDGREPIAAVTVGNEIYVACHLPDEATDASVMSANVVIISAAKKEVTKVLPLVNGASGVKDICASPDGATVYVSHVIGRYAYPTTQLDRGWINTNGFSVIDTKAKEVTCAVLLDEVDQGAANPWGLTVSADGKYLCAALSGLNEVMIIDRQEMHARIDKAQAGSPSALASKDEIVNYLPFLNGCRTRVQVGVGVRSITEKDGVLYCGNYFDGTITKITLTDKTTETISFITQPEAGAVRQGQILWSDANNCYQRWESCNSCHPDGIVDGFNWDNLNDGVGGGGKSAKSMLYAHRTPPVMITGIRPSAEAAVAAGMKFIQFNTMSSDKLEMIDEYLKSLAPLQAPALNKDGTLTESATAGKALFEKNCASCHPAPLYTDMKTHDVGSNTFAGDSGLYDTPTLVEVWRTGPYMHDGSLYTLEEVVRFFAKDLTDTEVAQLADFVRSICAEGEAYGVEQVHAKESNGSAFYNAYRAGSALNSVVIRKQSNDAPDTVVVALNVYDKDGVQVYYMDCVISGLANHATAVIRLNDGIVLPEGGSYTVSIYNTADGLPVATTLTIQ